MRMRFNFVRANARSAWLSTFLVLWACSAICEAASPSIDPSALQYNLNTTLGAYLKGGRKNPQWDGPATNCMIAFAQIRCSTNGESPAFRQLLSSNLHLLAATKCDDPFVRYLQLRFGLEENQSPAIVASSFKTMASALERSAYPEVRKFYANFWTCEAASAAQEPGTSNLLRLATTHLKEALQDPLIPRQEVDEATDMLLATPFWASPVRWHLYSILEPVLTNRWPGSFTALLAEGRGQLSHAWEARGMGYANSVSENAATLMNQRLATAARSLEAAWKVKQDSQVCVEMMRVELGQGQGRQRMELWFQRGMELDAANRDLCMEKLEYLRPRWYGNIKQMVAFGRECTANTNWAGTVRLMAADAHYEASREIQDNKQRADYWKQPQVWDDIKTAFEQFFRLYPEELGYRHNYARYALWSGQPQAFLDQVKLFPSTNYNYFGGVQEFNRATKMAQEFVSKNK